MDLLDNIHPGTISLPVILEAKTHVLGPKDVCWSLYVGREFCVAAPPTNTEMFRAVSMPLVDLDFDQMPWNHPAAKLEPQPNFLTKTFEATCELLIIARRIMDVV